MSRLPDIRWRKSDEKELRRLIKNFNAKISRAAKRDPDNVEFLPQRLTVAGAKAKIETRADFKRFAASVSRFSKRGSEKIITSNAGAKATAWEVDEFNRAQREVNKRKQRELNKLGQQSVRVAGEKQDATRAEMGRIKQNEAKPTHHDFKSKSQKEWEMIRRAMDNRLTANYDYKAKRYMQANYIRGLIHAGYSDEFIKFITTIDPEKFYEIASLDEAGTIEFIYDPLELEVRQEKMWGAFEEYGTGKNALGLTVEDIEQFDYYLNNLTNDGDKGKTTRELFERFFNI